MLVTDRPAFSRRPAAGENDQRDWRDHVSGIQSPTSVSTPRSTLRNLGRFAGLASLAATLAWTGCAAPDSEAAHTESEVQGGSPDHTRAHDFAVLITTVEGTSCSGTLIAPNLVLTARHCLLPRGVLTEATCADTFPDAKAALEDLRVTTSPTLDDATTVYGVRELTIPDQRSFCGNDIALLTLTSNVPASEARPARPLISASMTDRSLVGSQVAVVGYGVTEPTMSDSGLRRTRERIPILCVPGDDSYDCQRGYASLLGNEREFMTDGFVCSGDSGGGAFEQSSFSAGTPVVLGTLSRGPQTDTDCLAAIYTRTDAHAAMIGGAAVRAARLGGYPIPTWAAPEGVALGTTSCIGNICTSVSGAEPEPASAAPTGSCAIAPVSPRSPGSELPLALVVLAALLASRRRVRPA